MAIVERYERFIEYVYPILQNCPRKHGVVRDTVLKAVFAQVDLLIVAGKSQQPSRLYSADANLAYLRFWLRFMSSPVRRIITQDQHRIALEHLSEVKDSIEAFSNDQLGLRFSRWNISTVQRGVNYLGYRIWPSHKLLRKQSVTRAKRAIQAMRGKNRFDDLSMFVASWTGHARWADARNLLVYLGVENDDATSHQ